MDSTVIDLVSDEEDASVQVSFHCIFRDSAKIRGNFSQPISLFDVVVIHCFHFKEKPKVKDDTKSAIKRTASCDVNGSDATTNKIRRIQPTKIGEVQEKKPVVAEVIAVTDPLLSERKSNEVLKDDLIESLDEVMELSGEPVAGSSKAKKNELTKEMLGFITACRTAEGSTEMKQVIKKKVLRYYHSVHPDFVTSSNFRKALKQATEEILKEPHLVYIKLKVIVEELDARRKSIAAVVTTEESVNINGTGDSEKDDHLKKLYKGLIMVKRLIAGLEEAEVDWDDDENSSYIKKVRFERRACEIYKKVRNILFEFPM